MARPDPYLPWAGNPRRFYAVAMPNGDATLGIEGHLVFLQERRVGVKEPGSVLTRAEAEDLHAELGRALGAFALAKDLAREIAAEIGDRPRAYTGPWPIRGKTLAEVDALECEEAA
jgi:hypothetical protein